MAYGKVCGDTVYTCTGHPLPSDIANILDWALNKDFTTAYNRILSAGFDPCWGILEASQTSLGVGRVEMMRMTLEWRWMDGWVGGRTVGKKENAVAG